MEKSAILAAIRARLVRALTPPADPLVRFAIDGQTAGLFNRSRLDRLTPFARIFVIDAEGLRFASAFDTTAARTDAMAEVADALAAAGELSPWRDERYAVRAAFDVPPWFFLERACARWFGVRTWAVHVNGVADVDGEPHLWFARRSARKSIDPGRFDTLVGGGIAELEAADAAMRREAWEEAGIAPATALTARRAGHVDVRHVDSDGIQRETIFVYDVDLPAAFVPDNQDGEAVAHRRLALDAAASLIAAVQGADVTTLDACVVTLDYLTRRHDWPIADALRTELAALCRLPLD